MTLRALALKPGVFQGVFLTEHFAVKQGEIESRVKELGDSDAAVIESTAAAMATFTLTSPNRILNPKEGRAL